MLWMANFDESSNWTQIASCLSTSLQGFFISILLCFANPDVSSLIRSSFNFWQLFPKNIHFLTQGPFKQGKTGWTCKKANFLFWYGIWQDSPLSSFTFRYFIFLCRRKGAALLREPLRLLWKAKVALKLSFIRSSFYTVFGRKTLAVISSFAECNLVTDGRTEFDCCFINMFRLVQIVNCVRHRLI